MKCISKRTAAKAAVLSAVILGVTGCGSSLNTTFSDNYEYSNYNFLIGESGSAEVYEAFAADLCVAEGDIISAELPSIVDTTSAALFDLNNCETIYAKDIFATVYPASLTKVMTALVALENASLDTQLTATSNVYLSDASAQSAGLKAGDTMTLSQALHLLLIHSDNDVANLIAENIGGTISDFVDMMNAEAKRLGATNTNFVNANGLTDQEHYTCVYDMYLIFNEAMQFQSFQEIIAMSSYSTIYYDADGNEVEISVTSTNSYNTDDTDAPTGVTVIGGKTGTTTAAGHCLILYVRDSSGNPYIAAVMKALDSESCYATMNELLELIVSV